MSWRCLALGSQIYRKLTEDNSAHKSTIHTTKYKQHPFAMSFSLSHRYGCDTHTELTWKFILVIIFNPWIYLALFPVLVVFRHMQVFSAFGGFSKSQVESLIQVFGDDSCPHLDWVLGKFWNPSEFHSTSPHADTRLRLKTLISASFTNKQQF